MALTLYHVDWCPECAMVREKLDALGVPYEAVVVPDFRPFRKQVFDVSGQYYVPVLKDGDTVLTETRAILAYLDEHQDETGEKSAKGGEGPMGGTCGIGERGGKSAKGTKSERGETG